MPRQFSHVGAILVVGLVAQVGCDLALNRTAADGKTSYAAARRRRVMPPRDAVKLDLVTAPIGSRLNEVEIDAHPIRVTESSGHDLTGPGSSPDPRAHEQGLGQALRDLSVRVERADGVTQAGPVAIKSEVKAHPPVSAQPRWIEAGGGAVVGLGGSPPSLVCTGRITESHGQRRVSRIRVALSGGRRGIQNPRRHNAVPVMA